MQAPHHHVAEVLHFLIKEEGHEVRLAKLLIMMGMLSTLVLPPTHALYVNTAANLFWLWRI